MKKLIFALNILLPIIGGVFSSCGNNGCEQTRESFCLAEMTSLSGAKIDRLYVYGIGQGKGEIDSDGNITDGVMLNTTNPTSIEIILNPDSTITDIRLEMNITLDGDHFQYDDTIHFVYEPNPYFLDMECGCSMYFTLEDVTFTNHFLRNINIKNKEITNEENLNIVIEY